MSAALEFEDGFCVAGEASNGLEAIEACRALQPDAILLDLAMPLLDGVAAIAGIRRTSPDTRIVVFSGSREREMEALRSGADAFVLKGAGFREVIECLKPGADA